MPFSDACALPTRTSPRRLGILRLRGHARSHEASLAGFAYMFVRNLMFVAVAVREVLYLP